MNSAQGGKVPTERLFLPISFLYLCAVFFSTIRNNRRIITTLMIVLYLFIWASSSLFTHTHIVGNQIITHSHIYSKTKAHTHTEIEFKTISLLSLIFTVLPKILVLFAVITLLCAITTSPKEHRQPVFSGSIKLLRAPPLC